MTMYYIENNLGQIELYHENKSFLQNTIDKFKPELKANPILETDGVIIDGIIYSQEEYQQRQEDKEKERIAKLYLTRGDVLRGLLQAKGVTKEQIAQMIEAMPATNAEEILKKELAKIDFEDALNFYRGVELIDTIGTSLGISSKQLDEFFETNDYTKLM